MPGTPIPHANALNHVADLKTIDHFDAVDHVTERRVARVEVRLR